MATDITIPKGVPNSTVRQPVVEHKRTDGPGAVVKPVEQDKVRPSPQELQSAVSDLSNHFQNIQRNLSFSIDEDSGETVVKVIDAESQEVIRQMPSELALNLAQRLSEMSKDTSGVFLNSKV